MFDASGLGVLAGDFDRLAIEAPVRAYGVVSTYGQVLNALVKERASGAPGPEVRTDRYRGGEPPHGIHTITMQVGTRSISDTGTDEPQGYRLELGYFDTDSLGRTYCVDEASEILTARGWLTFDKVQEGDQALTLDPDTAESVWVPVTAVNLFPGPHAALLLETRTLSALTTHDHRWLVERFYGRGKRWVREWRTTATMSPNARVPLPSKPAPLVASPIHEDDLVELAAWFWTEGAYAWSYQSGGEGPRRATSRPIGVSISQSPVANPEKHERIVRLLTRMFGPPGSFSSGAHWREQRNATTGTAQFHLDRVAPWLLEKAVEQPRKILRPEFLGQLTGDQLELLIEVSLAADGCTDRNGVTKLGQADESRIRSFEMACALAGKATVTHERADREGRAWDTTLLRRPWSHGFNSALRPDRDVARLVSVTYGGAMWCPTTSTGTWLCRRNGRVYFTGNSQHPRPHWGPAVDEVTPEFEAALLGILPS